MLVSNEELIKCRSIYNVEMLYLVELIMSDAGSYEIPITFCLLKADCMLTENYMYILISLSFTKIDPVLCFYM